VFEAAWNLDRLGAPPQNNGCRHVDNAVGGADGHTVSAVDAQLRINSGQVVGHGDGLLGTSLHAFSATDAPDVAVLLDHRTPLGAFAVDQEVLFFGDHGNQLLGTRHHALFTGLAVLFEDFSDPIDNNDGLERTRGNAVAKAQTTERTRLGTVMQGGRGGAAPHALVREFLGTATVETAARYPGDEGGSVGDFETQNGRNLGTNGGPSDGAAIGFDPARHRGLRERFATGLATGPAVDSWKDGLHAGNSLVDLNRERFCRVRQDDTEEQTDAANDERRGDNLLEDCVHFLPLQ